MKYLKSISTKAIICYLLLNAVGCVEPKLQYKSEVVKNKMIIDGKFSIAYESGNSDYHSHGLYEKYEVGDTICFKLVGDSFWGRTVVDCN